MTAGRHVSPAPPGASPTLGVPRRSVLRGLLAVGPAALVLPQISVPPALAAVGASAPAVGHPWVLQTGAGLDYVAARLAEGAEPWTSGLRRLEANVHSRDTWVARPVPTVIRGGTGDNVSLLFNDVAAAYQNALRWRLRGTEANGAAAARILNAWSRTLTLVTSGNSDRILAAGIQGMQIAAAAELIRDRSDFDLQACIDMLLARFYTINDTFLRQHNNAVITNYWAAWDLCSYSSVLAIGGLADRQDLVDQALTYFETGAGNGSIRKAVPYVYDDIGLAQWQESGRDQGHTILGIGLMANFCEMAWNRGYDAYGYDDDRFAKAAEYVAKYNLGQDVPFTPYRWQSGPITQAAHVGWATQTAVSPISRGELSPVWATLLGHYRGRKGRAMPWVEQMVAAVGTEGGGGDYGPNTGGFDSLGFGTLTTPGLVLPIPPPPRVSVPPPPPPLPPVPVRIRSAFHPARFVGVARSVVRLRPVVAQGPGFLEHPGLGGAGRGSVSYESVANPGCYLVEQGGALRCLPVNQLDPVRATFERVPGLADPSSTSLRLLAEPALHVIGRGYAVRVGAVATSDEREARDATFDLIT